MIVFWSDGDVPITNYTVLPGVRLFWHDDRTLPPASVPVLRAAARATVNRVVRIAFMKAGTVGLPAGNLLDIVPDANGWRAV